MKAKCKILLFLAAIFTAGIVIKAAYINDDFKPRGDNVYDLGSTAERWKDVYVNNSLSVNSLRLASASITDANGTISFANNALTTNGLLTAGGLKIGSIQWSTGNNIDGEQIADDTIDDDSIDFTDVTVEDFETTVNILLETEIDASAELAAIMDDETGSGSLVFATSPTFNTSALLEDDAYIGQTAGVRITFDDTGNTATVSGGDLIVSSVLRLPTSANPTTDAEGEIALDNDDEALETYSNSYGSALLPQLQRATATIIDPDGVQSLTDTVTILPIEPELFPHGITVWDFGIKLRDNNLAYTVTLEEWTDPGTHANDLETVSASTGDGLYEYEDDGTIGNGSGGTAGNCNAGSILMIDLPTTDTTELSIWVTYTINDGN